MITLRQNRPLVRFGFWNICLRFCLLSTALLEAGAVRGEDFLSASASEFLRSHCYDCHGDGADEGGVQLDASNDWSSRQTRRTWATVINVVRDGRMPPEDADVPSDIQRASFVEWLDGQLMKHDGPGGTVLRRLNRREYENSISDLIGAPFSVPTSFPADTRQYGFDNVGESLVLSPPLMQQYFEVAGQVADQLIPPETKQPTAEPKTWAVPASELSFSGDGGVPSPEGHFRFFSSRNVIAASATWPKRFEAIHSGEYFVKGRVTTFQDIESKYPPRTEPYKMGVYARNRDDAMSDPVSTMRKLGEFEFEVTQDSFQEFELSLELMRGETVALRWENSPMNSSPGQGRYSRESLTHWLSDKRIRAAYNKIGYQRNLSPPEHYALVYKTAASPDLDINDPDLQDINPHFATGASQSQLWKFGRHDMSLHGPVLDLVDLEIQGPVRLIEDRQAREQRLRTETFLGKRDGQDDRTYASKILRRFLSSAFRRPCSDQLLGDYVEIALAHHQAGHRFEDGIHLAIRTALCSPSFLFRERQEGRLDQYDLAGRLSYFLTLGPPDDELLSVAGSGQLSSPEVLESQVRRLLGEENSERFLESFTSQWLELDRLPDIMPDDRLIRWRSDHLDAVTGETRAFIREIFTKNLPLVTFIHSNFTYMNRFNARLYGVNSPDSKFGNQLVRFQLPDDDLRRGGILTHPSVLMATANGVDTQPVLRGVWVLDNIFGTPPPDAPADIPAIESDTSGAKTIRDLLDRHQADPSCASCHRMIDPPGFALESFDAIGRWRDHYPVFKTNDKGDVVKSQGTRVDTHGKLTDGTELAGIEDLKRYLLANEDLFARCLAEKLLVYSTGRRLSYGDRQQLDTILQRTRDRGNGFRDLIVEVALSDSFRQK